MLIPARFAIASLSLFLFLVCPAGAQNTSDLTAKFGPPTLERYHVRPDVSLIVTYGQDHLACSLRVEPWQPFTFPGERTKPSRGREPRSISSDLADQLLNDLVPPSTRIGPPLQMVERAGCIARGLTEHQNVRISRGTDECLAGNNNVTSLVIQWKRPECPETNRHSD
jgi:hypothetical protein